MEPVKEKSKDNQFFTPKSGCGDNFEINSNKSKLSNEIRKIPQLQLNRKFRSQFTVANTEEKKAKNLKSSVQPAALRAIPQKIPKSELNLDNLKFPMSINSAANRTPTKKELVNLVKATRKYSARRSISVIEIRRKNYKKAMNANLNIEKPFLSIIENDAKNAQGAGEKIYNFMLLCAWRRRREDVSRLTEELRRTKNTWLRSKNQYHVMSAMYESENKHYQKAHTENERLQKQLLEILTDLARIKTENSILVQNNKDQKSTMAEMCTKNQDLRNSYNQSLNSAHMFEFHLEKEKEKSRALRQEKKELEDTIENMKFEFGNKSKDYLEVIKDHEREIIRNKDEMATMETKLKEHVTRVNEFETCDKLQRQQINNLLNDLANLQAEYCSTVSYKSNQWANSLPKINVPWIWCSHLVAHSFFPRVPAPLIEF